MLSFQHILEVCGQRDTVFCCLRKKTKQRNCWKREQKEYPDLFFHFVAQQKKNWLFSFWIWFEFVTMEPSFLFTKIIIFLCSDPNWCAYFVRCLFLSLAQPLTMLLSFARFTPSSENSLCAATLFLSPDFHNRESRELPRGMRLNFQINLLGVLNDIEAEAWKEKSNWFHLSFLLSLSRSLFTWKFADCKKRTP